jgi:hypothetical protein
MIKLSEVIWIFDCTFQLGDCGSTIFTDESNNLIVENHGDVPPVIVIKLIDKI